jgi:hypothetical protein
MLTVGLGAPPFSITGIKALVADHFGVEDEWRLAAPELAERLPRAEHSAATKGWRWSGEMEEIADTFAAAGQPDGFHRAAARVYRS